MGIHWSYDQQARNPIKGNPVKRKPFLVRWVDPESGKLDTAEYTTRQDAEQHANTVREIYGIPATIIER